MNTRIHVYISGLVQGVGFRFSTRKQAERLGLTGWVRNLADGRVEAEFEGPKTKLEEMLAWCRQGPGLSRVSEVQAAWEETGDTHERFEIRF